jgi:hypothetical protein
MAMPKTDLDQLRTQVTATIKRGTDLLSDLKGLDAGLALLLPSLSKLPASERDQLVARLCGYDPALPDRLRALIEGLADVVAGLTSTDGAAAWRRHQLERLGAGEAEEAA